MSRCRSCNEPVRWEHTASGRSIPLDVEPVDDGNVIIQDGVAIVLRSGDRLAPGTVRYVSHFVTCAQANDWRNR